MSAAVGGSTLLIKMKIAFSGESLITLANHVHKLSHGKVLGNQVLLLINVGNVTSLVFLANDRNPVRILGADALRFRHALLKGMIFLKLAHNFFSFFKGRQQGVVPKNLSRMGAARNKRALSYVYFLIFI